MSSAPRVPPWKLPSTRSCTGRACVPTPEGAEGLFVCAILPGVPGEDAEDVQRSDLSRGQAAPGTEKIRVELLLGGTGLRQLHSEEVQLEGVEGSGVAYTVEAPPLLGPVHGPHQALLTQGHLLTSGPEHAPDAGD